MPRLVEIKDRPDNVRVTGIATEPKGWNITLFVDDAGVRYVKKQRSRMGGHLAEILWFEEQP